MITWPHKPLAGSTPREWTERRWGECCFPFGEPDNTLSCCLPVVGEREYCSEHAKIMFVKGQPHVPKHSPKHGLR